MKSATSPAAQSPPDNITLLVHRARKDMGVAGSGKCYAKAVRRDPCAYCGGGFGQIGTFDHIIPKADGGSQDSMQNITAACYPCNRRKAARSLLDFLLRQAGSPGFPTLDQRPA